MLRRPVLTLLLLSSLTFCAGLGRQAITDSDEAYYAEAAREMVEGGDWLTPRFNYEDRWQKPVLYYWLTAGTYLIAGASEGAARFWSALSGIGLVLLTWTAARRLTERDDAAWLGGAIVATTFGYFAMARMALPDLPLTFSITLAIWAALRAGETGAHRLWALAGLAAGLGFILKGPVALVIPGVVLMPIWWRERRNTQLPLTGVALAAMVFAVVGLPWYVAMWREHGAAYFESFFVADNFERFATSRFNARRWPGYYIAILLGGMMPWTAFLVALAIQPAIDLWRRARRLSDTDWRLLLWAGMPILFFTVSTGQQPRYILPVLPPVAILLAGGIARRLDARDDRTPYPGPAFVRAAWATVAVFVIFLILLARAHPVFISGGTPWLGMIGIAVATIAMTWVTAAKRWRRLPTMLVLAAGVLLLAAQFGALAGVRPEAVEEMAALVHQHRTANERVGEYQAFVRNLVFYTRFKQEDLFNDEAAAAFVRSPDRVLLVVRAEDLERLESHTGVMMRRLGDVRYLNTNAIRLRTLIWPDPDRDVETVLLVSNR